MLTKLIVPSSGFQKGINEAERERRRTDNERKRIGKS